jgi:hypothetical protein
VVIIKEAFKEGHDLSVSLIPDSHSIRRCLVAGPSIAKQIAVMHSALLPVLTLSPLAHEKAAHYLAAGERGRLRGASERSPIRGFAAYHERFQRYRYRFVAGACMERVAEDGPW